MMPRNLVLVRHGQSEGNLARQLSERGDDSLFTEQFKQRHSSKFRLTALGRDQAVRAGRYLREDVGLHFDKFLVSYYDRAMETAALLGLPEARWSIELHLRERGMGDFDNMPESSKQKFFENFFRAYQLNPFEWTPPNGESVAEMLDRIWRLLVRMHRKYSEQNVLIVSHGMLMWGFRILLEHLTPWVFIEQSQSSDAKYKIGNCQIIHYTRVDPITGEEDEKMQWVRSVCPWDSSRGYAWQPIPRLKFTDQELLERVEANPGVLNL